MGHIYDIDDLTSLIYHCFV